MRIQVKQIILTASNPTRVEQSNFIEQSVSHEVHQLSAWPHHTEAINTWLPRRNNDYADFCGSTFT